MNGKIDPQTLDEIRMIIVSHLNAIEEAVCAPKSKLTLVIRAPRFPEGYCVVTSDSLSEVLEVITRARTKEAKTFDEEVH